jgi:type IV pilus assembly protein PilV
MKNINSIPNTTKPTRSAGFTLLEVLVALFVLAIGLLGLAMLQTTGLRFNTNSYSRTQATYVAYDIAERMRANASGFTAGKYDVLNTSAANTAISTYSSCKSSTCSCNTAICDSTALAKYDLGQWYNQQDTLLPGAKDAANLSPAWRATINRTNNLATITIYWLEQDRNSGAATTTQPVSQAWQVEIYP